MCEKLTCFLSGGNTIKKYSNKIEDLIRNKYDNFYFKNSIKFNIPLIGICHGAQFIAHKNNYSSVKVAKNAGFKWKETVKEEFTPVHEKPLDMELYELHN